MSVLYYELVVLALLICAIIDLKEFWIYRYVGIKGKLLVMSKICVIILIALCGIIFLLNRIND